jgi:hypothetical protein
VIVPFWPNTCVATLELNETVVAAAFTVRTVDPVTPLSVALIDDVPVATAVASPLMVIVPTVFVADAQVTWVVTFLIELSEYVPVAVNCCVAPVRILGLAGVTAMDFKAGVTVSTVEPVMPASFALIVDEPVATAVARPEPLIVATDVVADAQVT